MYQKFTYYNLNSINYNDSETIQGAFDFLKDLDNQNKLDNLNESFETMEIEIP